MDKQNSTVVSSGDSVPGRNLAKGASLDLAVDAVRLPSLQHDHGQGSSDSNVPLNHYFWLFRRNVWRIALFVLTATAAVLAYSYRLTPIYEATVSIDVDRQTPTGVIGQESNRAISNDADQFLATQVKLLQSDSVLRPVIERFQLPMRQPSRFRLVQPYTEKQRLEAPMVLSGLKVSRPPNTYLIQVSYRSENPKLAADTVNAIANSF
ncbi:MAG: Wzz/FepE/Etk N-terminal domain-containing protein, partial [Acidobacteriota bacterium]